MASLSSVHISNLYLKPVSGASDQRLTVGGTAVQFAAFSSTADVVMLQVQGADVYATVDGSAPVATTNGFLLAQNTSYNWSHSMAKAAKFISAGSAEIQAQPCTS